MFRRARTKECDGRNTLPVDDGYPLLESTKRKAHLEIYIPVYLRILFPMPSASRKELAISTEHAKSCNSVSADDGKLEDHRSRITATGTDNPEYDGASHCAERGLFSVLFSVLCSLPAS